MSQGQQTLARQDLEITDTSQRVGEKLFPFDFFLSFLRINSKELNYHAILCKIDSHTC